MNQGIRFRIAPTPSGYLHLGNVFSFVYTWLLARMANGKLILRIDDLDAQRMRPEYLVHIFDVLKWLNLEVDEGPQNPRDFLTLYTQQHRLPLYYKMLEQLRQTYELFACQCSRKLLTSNNICHCKAKKYSLDKPGVAWRMEVAENTMVSIPAKRAEVSIDFQLGQQMKSWIVRRKDDLPAYQVASLANDIQDGITTIVRGVDLLASSAAQIYMAQILNEQAFLKVEFLHHNLLYNLDGHKLSKSNKAPAFQPWASGLDSGEVFTKMGSLLELDNNQTFNNLGELNKAFLKRAILSGNKFG